MRSHGSTLIEDDNMYFSYNHFTVFDRDEEWPECDCTKTHVDQGFARRDSTVSFGTLLEFGSATLNVYTAQYEPRDEYERVVAVPFRVRSGEVKIVGPEEDDIERRIRLKPGPYRLYAAQRVVTEDEENMIMEEAIDLFFEPLAEPAEKSEIIVADAELNPPDELLEDADPIEL